MNDYDPNYKPVKNYMIVGQKIVVSDEKDRVLLLLRSSKSGLGGKWSIPGGALERREDAKDSILREIKEETNILVTDLIPFYVKTYVSEEDDFVVIIAYKAFYNKGEVVLNWEHDDYKWVKVDDALNMDLTSDARDILFNWKP